MAMLTDFGAMARCVDDAVENTPILDIHTHLYAPCFGDLLLYGPDELLTYHYLVAETFRYSGIPAGDFWAMDKAGQAALIYDTLFVRHTPVSEACRGVVTAMNRLGAPMDAGLKGWRRALSGLTREEYIDRVFTAAHVEQAIMTNDPLDRAESAVWQGSGYRPDPRFLPALRLDGLLINYAKNAPVLRGWGYAAADVPDEATFGEIRRFLLDQINIMGPMYMAVSLGSDFTYPDDSLAARLIDRCVVPVARQRHLPFALMIGVKRQMNPALGLAGDGEGRADVDVLAALCAANPDVKFMATLLSRENQHELCVTARKFRNLFIFGCWWFLNNPSLIEEMTRMRLELLGTSMMPQHSDARVLDQLVYKWAHSRVILARVLKDKYADLMAAGWPLQQAEIERDVSLLLGGAFKQFLDMKL